MPRRDGGLNGTVVRDVPGRFGSGIWAGLPDFNFLRAAGAIIEGTSGGGAVRDPPAADACEASMIGWALGLLAFNTPILLTGLYLAGALLLAALLIALVSRWRRRGEPSPLTPSQQLAQFRSLYERGGLSQEEFNRLHALLGSELRQEVKLPAQPPAPRAPAAETTQSVAPPAHPEGSANPPAASPDGPPAQSPPAEGPAAEGPPPA
jgi:hypothetical protein